MSAAKPQPSMEERPRGGRPSLKEAEAINRRILDAALECFLAQGFADVSMERVAQAAGVTKSTLYGRHRDKLSLFWKVLEDRQTAWGARSRRHDHKLGTALDQRLRYFARTMLAGSKNREVRALIKLIDGYWGSDEAALRSFKNRLRSGMIERLTDEIRRATQASGHTISDPRRAALAFHGILTGMSMHLEETAGNDNVSVRIAADYAVDVFLNGQKSW